MQARTRAWTSIATALAAAALGLALSASASAATREPLALAYATLRHPAAALDAAAQPDPRALPASRGRGERRVNGVDDVQISSSHYGQATLDAVAAVLAGLDHGPEMAQLSVYVATPHEIAQICGATVLACYLPNEMRMVVSGLDRRIAGVPRDFAIAHEYGHHIANTQRGTLFGSLEVGTARWATYERVCQFTRAGRLFPGNQGAHYWQDPEEAFAESYAHLNEPQERVSWQYTPLLAPTAAALAKIRADVAHPWRGPVGSTLTGSIAEPPAGPPAAGVRSGSLAVTGARAAGGPRWISSRRIRTPLDGRVSVTVQAPAGADLAVALRAARGGRVLARGRTGAGGSAEISYANCGRDALDLEVRSRHGSGRFEATVLRP